MEAAKQEKQRHWYNDRELFLYGFVRSNYVTAFTDWFMGLAGKATELVLYATVLYSCAQLYPGVHLPEGLSLAVFLIQMGALDVGGLSLGKLAKQAREDGNTTGATNAERLSRWLIGIMLLGVVTVGLEHALPFALPIWIIVTIDVTLVVARSICAVLYGKVVHSLKQDMAHMMPVAQVQATIEQLTEHLQCIEVNSVRQIEQVVNQFNAQLQVVQSEVVQQVQALVHSLVTEQVQPAITANQSILVEQFSMQIAATIQELKQELKISAEAARAGAPPRSGEHQRGSSPASSPRSAPVLHSITSLVQTDQGSESADEPVNVRVLRFIQEQVNQGHKPSLSEIMNQCKCSKNTAIRYRREIIGTDEEERTA